MKKNWLYRLSPCIIATILCLFFVIGGYLNLHRSGGWSMLGVIIFMPYIFILPLVDLLIKWIAKEKTFIIWMGEVAILLIIYFVFIEKYTG
jgi:predicted Na+-dependent transporter